MGSGWLIPLDVPVGIDGAEARRRAIEELAKSKYNRSNGWLDQGLDWLARLIRLLESALQRFGNQPGSGTGINWGFVIAVTVLLVGIGLVVWRVGLPKWRQRSGQESLDLDPTKAAQDYRALSESSAAAGDWRSAVRDRFRAIVRELEIRTILDVRPARTAWEAAYSAGRIMPAGADALYRGADLFNEVMYGDSHPDAASFAAMVAIDAAVTTAAEDVDLGADEAVPSR